MRFWLIAALVAALSICGTAQDKPAAQAKPDDLTQMSLEQLMKMEVTTASKRAQALGDVPAAIYVITNEDIRRSGSRNLPELLRGVPGLQVGQITSSSYRISARGFNSQFANKLLVMIDGRSVYTPLFSGVYWDAQDVMLEDVERIEVIRGPGGSLWGANAVNGIINIITKSAADTTGNLLVQGGGNRDRDLTEFRHGGKLGGNGFFRVFGKFHSRAGLDGLDAKPNNDAWSSNHIGFRSDWTLGTRDAATLQGDVLQLDERITQLYPTFAPPFAQQVTSDNDVKYWNLVGRWTRKESELATTSLQGYLDHSERHDLDGYQERRDTFDLDLQREHRFGSNNLVYGMGYRSSQDHTTAIPSLSFTPRSKRLEWLSGFFQDDVRLDERTTFSFGTKLERNSYTGWEVMPNARLLVRSDRQRTVWASVGRAVRTPNRAETGVSIDLNNSIDPNTNMPLELRIVGNPDFNSEDVMAHELGFRFEPTDRFTLDVAAYYNHYGSLSSFEFAGTPFFSPDPVPHIVVPVRYVNKLHGDTEGIEMSARWKASHRWKLVANVTKAAGRLSLDPSSTDPLSTSNADFPRHQVSLYSNYDAGKGLEIDGAMHWVDSEASGELGARTRFDLRLGWKPRPGMELSLSVQNVLNQSRPESRRNLYEKVGIPGRSIFLGLAYRF
jgi:iron complex outermembrane recepter protein